VEGTVLLKPPVADLMARVLTGQIQTTAAQEVLVEARPRPTCLLHSLGSEGMVVSTVVMVEEQVTNHILTLDPVRQAPPEASALAGPVEGAVQLNESKFEYHNVRQTFQERRCPYLIFS
jgi:hypothetical protein